MLLMINKCGFCLIYVIVIILVDGVLIPHFHYYCYIVKSANNVTLNVFCKIRSVSYKCDYSQKMVYLIMFQSLYNVIAKTFRKSFKTHSHGK
jgi:hypothetical protein